MGIVSACLEGIRRVMDMDYEYSVVMDGDGQMIRRSPPTWWRPRRGPARTWS